jgi:hypothetical protein
MSTPPRLTEQECPNCHHLIWVMDADFMGRVGIARDQRAYTCSKCGRIGPGWIARRQSPPEFVLQPHDLYPMAQEDFDTWVEVLRTHFPTHFLVPRVGTTFVPCLPEEAAAKRAAHDALHPVCEMRDQDGARRIDPSLRDVFDWLEMMNDGDTLTLRRRDGGTLQWRRLGSAFSGECVRPDGTVRTHMHVALETVHAICGEYLR